MKQACWVAYKGIRARLLGGSHAEWLAVGTKHGRLVWVGRPGPSRLGLAWFYIGLKMGPKNGFNNCMGLGPNQNNNNKNTIKWNKKK